MVVAAVAVIGKQNNPLFIRTFERSASPAEADTATQLHYVVHAALDVIEERGPCTAFASPISAGVESDVILTPDGS